MDSAFRVCSWTVGFVVILVTRGEHKHDTHHGYSPGDLAPAIASGRAVHPDSDRQPQIDSVTGFELFVRASPAETPVLYRAKNLSFTQDVLLRLSENGISHLFIRSSDERAYQRYMQDNLPAILARTDLGTAVKSVILYNSAQSLVGDEISVWARVCTICDIFDALTSKRSYKAAMNSYPALTLMKDEMLFDLDRDLFFAFVDMMGHPTVK